MNRSTRTSLSLIALSLALGGCSGSLLESKRIDYKSARKLERPLEIPPDLTAPRRDDRFAVPDVAPRGVATYSAYAADRGEAELINLLSGWRDEIRDAPMTVPVGAGPPVGDCAAVAGVTVGTFSLGPSSDWPQAVRAEAVATATSRAVIRVRARMTTILRDGRV